MKIEFLHHYHARHGLPLKERLIAYLPRYAPYAVEARRRCSTCATAFPALARATRALARLLAPGARCRAGGGPGARRAGRAGPRTSPGDGRDLVLFGDTFNRYLRAREPRGGRARARAPPATACTGSSRQSGGRPLCCGRTFLSAGLVDEARREARRTLDALAPFVARGARVVGLEPSCLFTFRDEFAALLPKAEVEPLAGGVLPPRGAARGRPRRRRASPCRLRDQGGRNGASPRPLPPEGLRRAWARSRRCCAPCRASRSRSIESSCCGMAGAFGYDAETIDVSFAMAELSLLPGACARPARTTSSSPTARAAATRSTTASAARRSMSRACSMRRSPEREDASSPGVDNRQAGERRLSAALAGPDPGPSPSYRAAAPRPRRLHHGRRCEWTIDRQGNDGSPPPLPGPIRPVPIARGRAPRPRRLHDARRCEWTIDKRGMHSSFAVRGVPPSGGRSTRSRGSATPGMARRHRRAAPHPRSGGGGPPNGSGLRPAR